MANIEALRQLRRVVKAAPADRLHMLNWVDDECKCGTAFCASGWAAQDAWFKTRGLQSVSSLPFRTDILGKIPEEDRMLLFAVGGVEEGLSGVLTRDPHAVTKAMAIHNIDLLIAGKKPRSYMAMIEEADARKRAPRAASKATSPRRAR